MRSTKHSDPVELVSIGADGLTIDDLLTEKISPELRWLNQGVSIGDAGIHPAESLLETFAKLDLPDYFLDYDLSSIKEDGLENLYLVGGDGDGHEYVVGVLSEVDPVFWTTGRHCLDGLRGRFQRAVWKASQGVRLPRPWWGRSWV